MSSKFALVLLSLGVLATTRILASPVSGALDSLSIDEIARHVCQNTEGSAQIGRISTILKLDDYYHDLPAGHQGSGACEDSLHALRELIEASQNNVCSDESVSAIENYHHRYISGEESLPPVLRQFFVHYASEISAICERVMLTHLDSAVSGKINEGDYHVVENGAPAVASRRILFGSSDKPDDQDNLLLLSSLIEKDTSEESINPLTGETVQLYLKQHNVGPVNALGEKCHLKFKPIYKALVLPVMRLANLGYTDPESMTSEQAKRWFAITQVCEIVLSIRYIEDSSLSADEVVSVSKVEAQQHSATQSSSSESPLVIAPVASTIDDELSAADKQSLLVKINSNLQTRAAATRKALARLADTVKRLPQNKAFISLPIDCDEEDGCSFNLVDMKESVGNSLEQAAKPKVPLKGEPAKNPIDSAKQWVKDEKEALGNVAYAVKALGVVLGWIAGEALHG